VKIVDLNVLLYAVNRDSPQHSTARAWLEDTLSGDEPVGLPWIVLLGFLRVATNRRVFTHALDVDDALAIVDSWLAQPAVVRVEAGDRHWDTLKHLLGESGAAGNLTTDAHLATLALENAAELCSTDADFARFSRLRWRNPLATAR
jgi:toxin-antitoxin system PIN domain toxin